MNLILPPRLKPSQSIASPESTGKRGGSGTRRPHRAVQVVGLDGEGAAVGAAHVLHDPRQRPAPRPVRRGGQQRPQRELPARTGHDRIMQATLTSLGAARAVMMRPPQDPAQHATRRWVTPLRACCRPRQRTLPGVVRAQIEAQAVGGRVRLLSRAAGGCVSVQHLGQPRLAPAQRAQSASQATCGQQTEEPPCRTCQVASRHNRRQTPRLQARGELPTAADKRDPKVAIVL